MKIILIFLRSLIILYTFLFIACDDDLNQVGSVIQPDDDNIQVNKDTFSFNMKTISLDSVFAWTTSPLLGNYEDNELGHIKSDYLCEFFNPGWSKELSNRFLKIQSIDSVQLIVGFIDFTGDTLAPMGLSVYELDRNLRGNFYTNIDPADYCSMEKVLGEKTYSISQAQRFQTSLAGLSEERYLRIDLDNSLGQRFINEYTKDNNAFQSSERFRQFFPGTYITTTFGSSSLVVVEMTSLDIFYTYLDEGGGSNQQDTIRASSYSLLVSPEVIQLNHVENTVPSSWFQEGTGASYIKSPAGVCLEIEFPILEIAEKIGNDTDRMINSVKFNLKGFSEKENMYKDELRPGYLLLIEKDSVVNFFQKKQLPNNINSILYQRDAAANTYNYYSGGTTSNNIGLLISSYIKKKIDKNPVFVVLPIQMAYENVNGSNTITGIYNYMKPSTSIIRSGEEYLKMEVTYSKY